MIELTAKQFYNKHKDRLTDFVEKCKGHEYKHYNIENDWIKAGELKSYIIAKEFHDTLQLKLSNELELN